MAGAFPLCLCAAPSRAKVPQPLLQPEHLPCLDPGPQHCHHHSLPRSRAPGRPDSNSSPLLPPLPPSDARIYVPEPLAIWRALPGSLLPSIRWRWTGFIPGGGPLIRTPTDPTPAPLPLELALHKCHSLHCTCTRANTDCSTSTGCGRGRSSSEPILLPAFDISSLSAF